MAVVQQPPTASDYFQNQFPSVAPSQPIIWKEGWDVNNAPSTKRQLSMVGPTSPAQSVASGTSSPRRLLHTLTESDEENIDSGSESDQPLYSAAVESFLNLKEPTPQDFKPCEPAKSEIRPSKPRTISFDDAKADINEIWPFTEVKSVRVKKASLTSVDKEKWPSATITPVIPVPEEKRLLELDVKILQSPDKSAEERLQEAEKLLIQFQSAYKTRAMSVHQLEKQVDDQASQLQDSEIWNESVARRMMSLTARISEQENAILQLGQELGKEKEMRREEEEEAFQHKLDGLNRVYPPLNENTHRRMSSIPGLNRSEVSFNNNDGSRRESTSYAAPRYYRQSSTASFSSASGGQGRRPSFFARMFRQGSESSSSSGSGSPPPQSRLSSFSSRASTALTSQSNPSKVAVAADKDIETAVDRVKALEDIKTEVGVLRQKLESLELALSALNDFPPAGTVDISLSP
ncbi:uncharacterized protein Z520_07161 [Fonsecaea multimorphosa CBS 102226]|uniref:Uncharacterized protein n=1 Tax=Fonsecaea multimorphosa CBS 102226 TaxID=1442371 RepID=A0A0D2JU72_9EURO|nr:uncharacterized protein Z520_07161 [Fonsecaea multimorphosa CBS 102226]KIX97047.1 hypothetical protein Z520_07161 [Fonsecaea multimorphosa CBS 102226]OAL22823.1 hypothetical protein AYO22_06731 [Fonsecaea multimorphosa]